MPFDASKSKLHSQILDAAVVFFGLNAETATEADIHNAFDGATPLAKQIEDAKEQSAKDFTEVKERLSKLESEHEQMKAAADLKDQRIAELQTENSDAAAKATKELADLKAQHKTETEKLAGEISAIKAGKKSEQDSGGDTHPAGEAGKETTPKVVAAKSDELKALAQKKRNSN